MSKLSPLSKTIAASLFEFVTIGDPHLLRYHIWVV